MTAAASRAGAIELAPGLVYTPGYLGRAAQEALRDAVQAVLAEAPLFRPAMPRSGTPFSVEMSNCGPLGWVSDRDAGYRYQAVHPVSGRPWPAMPAAVRDAWTELTAYPAPPEACLINYYGPGARMGMHQDRDEHEFDAPVLSLSLGDSCVFRWGGTARGDKTRSFRLASGDALVIGGANRLVFHGVDRLIPGSSTLLPQGGRLNLTLRRVNAAP
jgi:alkylated DNA repair protein (DNA oxidative demethylase)